MNLTWRELVSAWMAYEGINQTALAVRMDMTRQGLSDILSKQTPYESTVAKVAAAFRVTPEQFLKSPVALVDYVPTITPLAKAEILSIVKPLTVRKESSETYCAILNAWIDDTGVTQAEVAMRTGLNENTVSAHVNGRPIPASARKKYAQAFGVSLFDFLQGPNPKNVTDLTQS